MAQDKARGLVVDDIGRRLQELRRSNGISRAKLARSSGVSRRKVVALERGKAASISTADLSALATACGADVDVLERPAFRLTTAAGPVSATDPGALQGEAATDALLREYVSMVFELRESRGLSPAALRQDDLSELARALGGTPEAIEARLVTLLGADEEQAWRLRTAIVPSLGNSK
jgi:transcriptional regulator with XRE-family HTH domain